MKCIYRASGLVASLIVLLACGPTLAEKRITQCKAVAENYSAVIAYEHVGYNDERVDLTLTVRSAIKNLSGNVSCQYSDSDALPTLIVIGNTEHRAPNDISDLIAGKYLDGNDMPEHSH